MAFKLAGKSIAHSIEAVFVDFSIVAGSMRALNSGHISIHSLLHLFDVVLHGRIFN